MLTTAHPIFEHVPGSFADPAALADQQAPGVVSLVVAHYPAPDGAAPAPEGPSTDAFVAVSGSLLAVARSTPDYRFPVTPAAALTRFFQARDGGHPTALSLYEVSRDDCARFLETVFYAECLKLHVDGPASAPLVAAQLARCGCRSGLLEVNDFSDPDAPRVRLVDLDGLAAPDNSEEDDPLAGLLPDLLDGVAGRVLLYDRQKNRAVFPGRTGQAFDLDAALAQADRLARARHADAPTPQAPETAASEPDPAAPVEAYLRDRAERPRLVDPAHPHAQALGALVAELQGTPLTGSAPAPLVDDLNKPPENSTAEPFPVPHSADSAPPADTSPPPLDPEAAPDAPSSPVPHPLSPAAQPPHPLARPLDALRVEVWALLEDAVGQDRALAHEAHVTAEAAIPAPVPPDRTVEYLRALLTADPPKRWHFFKRSRARLFPDVADKLLAFHAAHGHVDSPAVHDVSQLWARLHR